MDLVVIIRHNQCQTLKFLTNLNQSNKLCYLAHLNRGSFDPKGCFICLQYVMHFHFPVADLVSLIATKNWILPTARNFCVS